MRAFAFILLLLPALAFGQTTDGGTQPSASTEVREALTVQLPVPDAPALLPSTTTDTRAPVPLPVPNRLRVIDRARDEATAQATAVRDQAVQATALKIADDAAKSALVGQSSSDVASTATQQAQTAAAQSSNGTVTPTTQTEEMPEDVPTDVPIDMPSRPTRPPRP